MKKIDEKLKQWVPVNTIVREEIRAAIMKERAKQYTLGVEAGLDYKQNTNKDG